MNRKIVYIVGPPLFTTSKPGNVMRRLAFFILLALILMFILGVDRTTFAQNAPDSVSFQGFLLDDMGEPLDTAAIEIKFRLLQGAVEIWTETQTSVPVSSGVFDVILGRVTSLSTVDFDTTYTLGITVGNPPDPEITASLASAPYALGLRGIRVETSTNGLVDAHNIVGGWHGNVIGAGVGGATIGGGGLQPGGPNAVSADFGTIGGGYANTVTGPESVIAGGRFNTVETAYNTIGGGASNVVSNDYGTIGGGESNVVKGDHGAIPGGKSNVVSAAQAFSAGSFAEADDDGAFVWQDGTGASGGKELKSTASHQWLARASGGVIFLTAAAPDFIQGAELPAGGGGWGAVSARETKTDFKDLDREDLLDKVAGLDIQSWSYKTEATGVRHIGPVAEDFYGAFGLGHSERTIVTVDADGVALAAIQALYARVQEQDRRIEELEAALRSR